MKRARTYVVYLSAFAFFVAALSLAYHYNENPFKYATCSICKIKNSFSSSVKKKTDHNDVAVSDSSLGISYAPDATGQLLQEKSGRHTSRGSHPLSNKAPPLSS